MKRRFLSMILCLTMLIILPTGASAYGLTDNYNDEIQTYAGAADPDPNGDGTEENPYLITSANPKSISVGTTVTVDECTTHEFKSGKCKYCGYICKHENADYKNTCTVCDEVLPVLVREPYNDKITYGRYSTLEEAFASINQGEKKEVVYLGTDDYTFEDDIEIKGTVYYYSTFGKSLNFNNGKSFVVKDGGALCVSAYGYISAVTLEAGSVYSSEPDFAVGTLTVYDGSKILINHQLQNGNFEKIIILNGDKKVGDVLNTAVHRTFRHKGADGSWATGDWATDEELGETSIENVSVVGKPFYNESITVDVKEQTQEYNGKNFVTMKATLDKSDTTPSGEITYDWYEAFNGDRYSMGKKKTESTVKWEIYDVGTYTYECDIEFDGYKRTVRTTITINKGTPTYTKEPKAIENLVYSGDDQELVEAGTIGADQKILYKLDDGDWSENIPKAEDAGVYKVSYKVEESDNYSGIAEKDFNVTISKKVLDDIVTGTVSKQYDGKKDLPNGFNITKFKDSDESELTLPGGTVTGEYESAGAGENKKITLTVNLGDLAKNYVFDNGTAEKTFEKTGTITKAKAPQQKDGELTIVKDLERVYTYDLSTLLTGVPDARPYGKITYGEPYVDMPNYYNENEGKATIDENGILTLPIQSNTQTYDDAGTVTVKATTENYNDYQGNSEITLTVNVKAMDKIQLDLSGKPTLNPEKITYGQKLKDIELSGSLKGFDGNTVKGTFSWKNPDTMPSVGNASAEWNFTPNDTYYMYENADGTVDFTVEPKDISSAVIMLADSLEYNGSEQTQAVASVKIGEMTLSESDYDISENKATDVKADGNYVLTITGKGNFSGTKTAEWNIKPTVPTENADKKTTARVRKGKTLASATLSNGEMMGVIPGEVLSGSFEWVDDTIVMNQSGTAQIKFKPDNTNYKETIFNVDVSTYSSGKGGSTSVTASYTVKFDTNGGSKISSVSVSKNNTVKEPTSPEKDGYKFDGWYTDKNYKNKYDFSTKVVKNFTLYAAWVKIETEPDPDPTDKPTLPDTENLFDDVEKDDWYYDDVTDAVKKGLFNGTDSKIFDPNGIITRGMFVTVLYRSEGEPAVNKSISFEDISKDSYYANAVIWAEQNEIVNGISETEFAPNQNITREQIATIMFRFAKYKGYDVTQGGMQIREFEDYESISDYALSAMTWAVNTGLMKGKTESFINPHDSATRAEVAAILNRFLKSEK